MSKNYRFLLFCMLSFHAIHAADFSSSHTQGMYKDHAQIPCPATLKKPSLRRCTSSYTYKHSLCRTLCLAFGISTFFTLPSLSYWTYEGASIDYPEFSYFLVEDKPAGEEVAVISLHIAPEGQAHSVSSCKCTEANHNAYVQRHPHYKYRRYKKRDPNATWHVKFDKYAYVLSYMLEHPHLDYLLYIDCDAFFKNLNQEIPAFFTQQETTNDTSIVIARDARWYLPIDLVSRVNTGAILFKPSPWLYKFLWYVISAGKMRSKARQSLKGQILKLTPLVDQPIFNERLMQEGQLRRYPFSQEEVNQRVTVVSPQKMNAFYFPDDEYSFFDLDSVRYKKKEGAWIVHMPGRTEQVRLQLLKKEGLCMDLPETALLEFNQAHYILSTLQNESHSDLLICGVDSGAPFFAKKNKGKTFFIEKDQSKYLESIQVFPHFNIHPIRPLQLSISLDTLVSNKERWHILDLTLLLPQEVTSAHWKGILLSAEERDVMFLAYVYTAAQIGIQHIFINSCEGENASEELPWLEEQYTYISGHPSSDGEMLCHYQYNDLPTPRTLPQNHLY